VLSEMYYFEQKEEFEYPNFWENANLASSFVEKGGNEEK